MRDSSIGQSQHLLMLSTLRVSYAQSCHRPLRGPLNHLSTQSPRPLRRPHHPIMSSSEAAPPPPNSQDRQPRNRALTQMIQFEICHRWNTGHCTSEFVASTATSASPVTKTPREKIAEVLNEAREQSELGAFAGNVRDGVGFLCGCATRAMAPLHNLYRNAPQLPHVAGHRTP